MMDYNVRDILESFKNIIIALLGTNQLNQYEFYILYSTIRNMSCQFLQYIPAMAQAHIGGPFYLSMQNLIQSNQQQYTDFIKWLGSLIQLTDNDHSQILPT